jgi:hypothetical protein
MFAAILLLAAAVLLRESGGTGEGEELLFGAGEEAVDRFAIRNDSLDALFRKEGEEWRIEGPIEDRADPVRVEAILRAILETKIMRVVDEEPEDLAPYGLDPPAGMIAVAGETASIGARNPTADGVYVLRPPARAVLLADNALLSAATLSLDRVRDRALLRFPAQKTEVLVVRRGGETRTLRREGSGRWRIEELDVRANAPALGGLLSLLGLESIHSFDDSLMFRPGDEELSFRVVWEGGETSLRIGAAIEGTSLAVCAASDRENSSRIPRYAVDSLVVRIDRLLDRRLFARSPLEAEAVSFRSEDASFDLARREDGGWFLTMDGETFSAFAAHARAFLRRFESIEAARALAPGTIELPERAAWRITAGEEPVEIFETLRGLVARREGETGLLLLEEAVRPLLDVRAGYLLDHDPAPAADGLPEGR